LNLVKNGYEIFAPPIKLCKDNGRHDYWELNYDIPASLIITLDSRAAALSLRSSQVTTSLLWFLRETLAVEGGAGELSCDL